MPIGTLRTNEEKKMLMRFYDKFTGAYMIPMKEITDEIAEAMITVMQTHDFVVTGVYDLNGSYEIKNLQDPYNLGYIMYEKKDLQEVKDGLLPSHKKLFDDAFFKRGFGKRTSYEIPLNLYQRHSKVQDAVDEILYLGMLNPNKNDGYSVCMGIRGNYFVFMEAFEVGA